jgi:Ca2+-binding EF-hand superfamily protein
MINSLKEQNKPIKFDEFLTLMCEKVGETKTKDGLRRVYAIFDKNEDGVIDFEELKQLLREMKEGMNDDDIL